MGFFGAIFAFFGNIWAKIEPTLKKLFKGSTGILWAFLQDMAIAVVQQIATQGLPTGEAKQKAFSDAMKAELKRAGMEANDAQINLVRELAVNYCKEQGLIE